MKPPGVMQVVDSLDLGGTETVAVNLANRLPRDRFRNYLCSTRAGRDGGPLAASLEKDVQHLALDRKSRVDIPAMLKFRQFVRDENIQLLHVHASSLFFGRLATWLGPSNRPRVIWHDHYGRCELNDRSPRLYRLAVAGTSGVVAVNHNLVEWDCRELHMSRERVWYVPNFAVPSQAGGDEPAVLPGAAGSRIVCVANLRPQKDHFTLLRAFALVRNHRPDAHLLVVGAPIDANYVEALHRETSLLGLEKSVSFLGQVPGVSSVLKACDIAVLSSASEGLPLSLLEYGAAGLPSVATSVGQCPEVLDHGKAGILVDPGAPEQLAKALRSLLDSSQDRARYGRRFQEFVRKKFDATAIVNQICDIYDLVLSAN